MLPKLNCEKPLYTRIPQTTHLITHLLYPLYGFQIPRGLWLEVCYWEISLSVILHRRSPGTTRERKKVESHLPLSIALAGGGFPGQYEFKLTTTEHIYIQELTDQ